MWCGYIVHSPLTVRSVSIPAVGITLNINYQYEFNILFYANIVGSVSIPTLMIFHNKIKYVQH